MTNKKYKFQKIDDLRWGIYLKDRLLATVGSYEACESMAQILNSRLSSTETLKAKIAYKQAINQNLSIR